MNSLLVLGLVAFGAALAWALVIMGWRQRVDQERARPAPDIADADLPMLCVVIPVRNGASTITALLQDLHAQDYPQERLHVIVVDDHSDDGTMALVQGMLAAWSSLRAVHSELNGKKAAITAGVHAAVADLIVLTDADVRCGRERLRRIAAHDKQASADLLLLPVRTVSSGGFLGHLQEDEQAALLGAAAGSALSGTPFLAYGANLAFSKATFIAVGGYQGDRFASGDDLFLLERMKSAGKRVRFALDPKVVVTATAEGTRSGWWQQRLRWAGKMRGVRGRGSWSGLVALLLPWFLVFISMRFCASGTIGQGFFRSGLLLAGAWLLWLVPVLGLVRQMRTFLGLRQASLITALSLLCFTIYAPLIAVTSLFVRARWKGRVI